jgi:hypothetical protein
LGEMNSKRPTAIKGTMEHENPSVITEMFAGAIISVAQYLAPLRYLLLLLLLLLSHERVEVFTMPCLSQPVPEPHHWL